MNKSDYYEWLRLVSVKGLGPETIQKLLTKYSTPGSIFHTSKEELTELSYISYKTRRQYPQKSKRRVY